MPDYDFIETWNKLAAHSKKSTDRPRTFDIGKDDRKKHRRSSGSFELFPSVIFVEHGPHSLALLFKDAAVRSDKLMASNSEIHRWLPQINVNILKVNRYTVSQNKHTDRSINFCGEFTIQLSGFGRNALLCWHLGQHRPRWLTWAVQRNGAHKSIQWWSEVACGMPESPTCYTLWRRFLDVRPTDRTEYIKAGFVSF